MEGLIPIVNKLQDAFTQLGVHMQLGKNKNTINFKVILWTEVPQTF